MKTCRTTTLFAWRTTNEILPHLCYIKNRNMTPNQALHLLPTDPPIALSNP